MYSSRKFLGECIKKEMKLVFLQGIGYFAAKVISVLLVD